MARASSSTHFSFRTSASCLLLVGPPASGRVLGARAEPSWASPPGLSVRWSVAGHVCSAGPPSSLWLLALKAEKLAGCERVFQVGRGGEEGRGRAGPRREEGASRREDLAL